MQKRARTVLGSVAAVLALTFTTTTAAQAQDYWQCAYFARLFSGIQIFGDAWTWWNKANGHYAKGSTPQSGAVLVFRPQGSMKLGHVSVVSQVLTDRVIQVTHANWSRIGGTRGQIEKNVTVVDVSPRGDWSQVKVWYDGLRDLGSTTYSTYGFVYSTPVQQAPGAARGAALTVAQAAAGQVAQASRPTASTPLQSIARVTADSTDRIAALIQSVAGGDAEGQD
jgi:surface antigen